MKRDNPITVADRASMGEEALYEYNANRREQACDRVHEPVIHDTPESDLVDLMTDLLHFADSQKIDVTRVLATACSHHYKEKKAGRVDVLVDVKVAPADSPNRLGFSPILEGPTTQQTATAEAKEPWIWLQDDEGDGEDEGGLVRLVLSHNGQGPAVWLSPQVQTGIDVCEHIYVAIGKEMDADEPVQGSDAVQMLSDLWVMIRTAAGKGPRP